MILPVDLYGCETWSLALREKDVSEQGDEEVGENCLKRTSLLELFTKCN
jgi:hypothetical protein